MGKGDRRCRDIGVGERLGVEVTLKGVKGVVGQRNKQGRT